jgi:hypothetical protein
MNHILDILHGRPAESSTRTDRKHYNRSLIKDKSHAKQIDKLDDSLPPLLLTKKERTETADKHKPKTYRPM